MMNLWSDKNVVKYSIPVSVTLWHASIFKNLLRISQCLVKYYYNSSIMISHVNKRHIVISQCQTMTRIKHDVIIWHHSVIILWRHSSKMTLWHHRAKMISVSECRHTMTAQCQMTSYCDIRMSSHDTRHQMTSHRDITMSSQYGIKWRHIVISECQMTSHCDIT